jgi:hypothetical protein
VPVQTYLLGTSYEFKVVHIAKPRFITRDCTKRQQLSKPRLFYQLIEYGAQAGCTFWMRSTCIMKQKSII